MDEPKVPSSILITGASSGIGRALALAYAHSGTSLFLVGRDAVRLAEVAQACEAKGAAAQALRADVRDQSRMDQVIAQADSLAPLDLVIANAGINAVGADLDLRSHARDVFEVNMMGVVNTVLPALDAMRPRGRGQIALMSSFAGLRRVPSMPSYSASKAAVRVWGEALRVALLPHNIKVSVICPGFVGTGMAGDADGHARVSAEDAAQIIIKGLAANSGTIAFPPKAAMKEYAKAMVPPQIIEMAQRLRRRIGKASGPSHPMPSG